ncbi:MAG: multicopper oxidase family protein [bacterium]|nr:multicopper oxidase family protein [bacterium]
MRARHPLLLLMMVLGVLLPAETRAGTVVLTSDRDTMIQEDYLGTPLTDERDFSNGSGSHFCVGQTGQGTMRRALLHFDIAGSSIPAGALINSVTLTVFANNVANPAGSVDFSLHRLLADWGEGPSFAPNGECKGTGAATGDATWADRFFNVAPWAVEGSDFAATPSATETLSLSFGTKTLGSAQMAVDVKSWLDSPAGNFGWVFRLFDEVPGATTAMRFGSRQNPSTGQRPTLTVDFTPPDAMGACCSTGQLCQELQAATCFAQGGSFQGIGTDCTPNLCPPDPVGACCNDDGNCSETTEAACQGADETYQGDGTSCALAECPIILEPFVDALPIPAVAQPVSGTAGGVASYEVAAREIQQQLHRDLPPTTVWGYGTGASGASFPGPTIETAANQPVSVTWLNDLRDTSLANDPLRTDHYLDVPGLAMPPECHIHGAEDLPKIVVHLHGAHVEAEFDGYPEFTYLPGNQDVYHYSNKQLPSTLWYHDHALGITRLNVYMGLAGFWLIRDAFEQSLPLPAGEFEIPLVIQDRSFNPDGSLKYTEGWNDHFFGKKILVNGMVWPFLDVKQGKYRFRLLNGSGSRTYTLSLDRLDLPGTADVPFVQIGTDGGLIEVPLGLDEITLGPAERMEIVVDFAGMPQGTEIVMTNSAPAPFPGTVGSGVVPNVMKFVVANQPGHTTDLPATLRPYEAIDELSAIKVRDFELNRDANACGGIWTINGLRWDDVIEYPQLGTTEIWRFNNPSTVTHPMHMHLVMFQVLDRVPLGGGAAVPPDPTEVGWKDTALAPPGMSTRVIARFEDYEGLFAYHCHILEHEDHEMMRQFHAVAPVELSVERTQLALAVQPGATGYDIVRGNLPQLRDTDGNFALNFVTSVCVGNDVAGPTVVNNELPSAGHAFWYLARSVGPGGDGTYDSGSSSQVDSRDDEIGFSANRCP